MNDKQIIDIEEYSKAGKNVPKDHHYRIRIDKTHYTVEVPGMTGKELLELAGKSPVDQYNIYQKLQGGQSVEIAFDQFADFTAPGVERFITIAQDQTEG
jgi:hypothetical protein